jgi:hypothetical protein
MMLPSFSSDVSEATKPAALSARDREVSHTGFEASFPCVQSGYVNLALALEARASPSPTLVENFMAVSLCTGQVQGKDSIASPGSVVCYTQKRVAMASYTAIATIIKLKGVGRYSISVPRRFAAGWQWLQWAHNNDKQHPFPASGADRYGIVV